MKTLKTIVSIACVLLFSCNKKNDDNFIQDYITKKTLGTVTDANIYNVTKLNDSTYTATYEHYNVVTKQDIKLDVTVIVENIEGKKVVKKEKTNAFYVKQNGEFKEI